MLSWALKKVFGTSHEREIRRLRPRVEAINALGPAIAKLTDAELRGEDRRVQAEARQRRHARRPAPRSVRRVPRGRQARRSRCATTTCSSSAAWSSTRLDRRDADRRGQDPRRDAALLPQRARGQGRARRHGERLPRPARLRVDGEALQLPRPERRRRRQLAGRAREEASPTGRTSRTARTTSSASTTCATT